MLVVSIYRLYKARQSMLASGSYSYVPLSSLLLLSIFLFFYMLIGSVSLGFLVIESYLASKDPVQYSVSIGNDLWFAQQKSLTLVLSLMGLLQFILFVVLKSHQKKFGISSDVVEAIVNDCKV